MYGNILLCVYLIKDKTCIIYQNDYKDFTMVLDNLLSFSFYLIAIIGFGLVYRENQTLKNKLEQSSEEFTQLQQHHDKLQKEFEALEKVDQKQRFDIKNLKAFKTEAARLRLLLQKVKDAYISGKSTGNIQSCAVTDDMDKMLHEEVKLLKEQEEILKQEEAILQQDNKLLEEENQLLTKELVNLKKQIQHLREANKQIPKYLETIDKLNKDLSSLIEDAKK